MSVINAMWKKTTSSRHIVLLIERMRNGEDQVSLGCKFPISFSERFPIGGRPVTVVVGTIVNRRASSKSWNEPMGIGQRREHKRLVHIQSSKNLVEPVRDELSIDPPQSRFVKTWNHRNINHPHLITDFLQSTSPISEFLEASSEGQRIRFHLASANRIHPKHWEGISEPPDHMLTTRRMSPPVVGEDKQGRVRHVGQGASRSRAGDSSHASAVRRRVRRHDYNHTFPFDVVFSGLQPAGSGDRPAPRHRLEGRADR